MQVKIFFCYAHEDEELLNRLKDQLNPLQREGLIVSWHDRDINAGTEWEQEIDKHLNTAQIILLLVSPDFIASDYCYGIEMKRALERHERGEARVIPIILRYVHWQGVLGKLQALPTDARPIKSWSDLDEALYNVVQGIRKVVKSIQPPLLLEPKLQAPLPDVMKVGVQAQKEQPDSQAFGELKTFYPWLGDDQLALLQGVYHTWRQLAGADPANLWNMLSGIPRPPESPEITYEQVGIIQSFARAKV